VQENLRRIFRKEIEIIPVSSVTGEGIDELRTFLSELLQKAREKKFEAPGFIHIDRVFTIKGSGTVITGSLSGGTLSEEDELTILPQGITTRIRGIQSYYSGVKTAYPVSRVACNLQGLKKEDISRGCIAATDPDAFRTESEFIIQWEELDTTKKTIKNHMELELACGTGHYIGTIHFLKTSGFARIVLKEAISVSWFDPFVLIRQGGHHILARGRFIWAGKTERHFRIHLSSILEQYPVPKIINEESVLRFILNDWLTFRSDSERYSIETFTAAEGLKIRTVNDSLILEERFRRELDNVIKLASRAGGVSKAEYFQALHLPLTLKESLVDEALKTNNIVQKDQILISREQLEGEESLSPQAKKLLDMLHTQYTKGVQLKDITEPGAKKDLRNLARIGKVVALEGDIYFSTDTFHALARDILEGHTTGSSFSIPEAKERTGLSRRYIIPLLNKMEEKGMVKRDGDIRIVC
jgi:selenocysteine-specific elongation factor